MVAAKKTVSEAGQGRKPISRGEMSLGRGGQFWALWADSVPAGLRGFQKEPERPSQCFGTLFFGGLLRGSGSRKQDPVLFFLAEACEILVLFLGMEPVLPAWKRGRLNHWTTREVPGSSFEWLQTRPSIKFVLNVFFVEKVTGVDQL